MVFALAGVLAVGMRVLGGEVRDPSSVLHSVGGTIGTGVSGGFLYLIAALNLVVLWWDLRAFCATLRTGASMPLDLERSWSRAAS